MGVTWTVPWSCGDNKPNQVTLFLIKMKRKHSEIAKKDMEAIHKNIFEKSQESSINDSYVTELKDHVAFKEFGEISLYASLTPGCKVVHAK